MSTKIIILILLLALPSCSTTKPNVDITVVDNGKGVRHITGRIPAQSTPLSFVFALGSDALKLLFPAL